MIRPFSPPDIDNIMEIWLNTNISAHPFIPSAYWKSKKTEVRAMILQANIFVYEDQAGMQGFMGLVDSYLAGIFVKETAQSQGIGKQLMDYAKKIHTHILLHVYTKNTRAVNFYKREAFAVTCEQVDAHTGEAEYTMEWVQ